MASDRFTVVDGAAAGAWIEPAQTGEGGSVAHTVPACFEAYARILHPASDERGNPLRWSQVAEELGRTVHPTVQWDALVGANRYRHEKPDWRGHEPDWGYLPLDLLGSLCELLGQYAEEAERCLFGIWLSHWTPGTHIAFAYIGEPPPPEPPPPAPAFTPEELGQPLLELPPGAGREYRVIRGPLRLATEISELIDPGPLSGIAPNMIWPANRAWYMASEIDFDSTLVGGSEDLIQAILDAPEFEALAVAPEDSLTWDADRVNPPLRAIDD